MTNTIAQGVAEKFIKEMDTQQLCGKSSVSPQYVFKDDTFSERHENLLERFPSKDISDIRKLEKTLDTYDHSDMPMEEISELCLENDIVSPELLLMDVMFKNDLKTASRNGITLLNIDGSLEIRNGEEKFLSPQEVDLMKEYLVGEDDDVPPGFQAYYDVGSRKKTTTTMGGGGSSSFQGELRSVDMGISDEGTVQVKGEVQF